MTLDRFKADLCNREAIDCLAHRQLNFYTQYNPHAPQGFNGYGGGCGGFQSPQPQLGFPGYGRQLRKEMTARAGGVHILGSDFPLYELVIIMNRKENIRRTVFAAILQPI